MNAGLSKQSILIMVLLFLSFGQVLADITSNLSAHWTFDDATGSVAYDASGNGNNGALINGPAWTTGKISGAISLDGINDYVDAGSASNLDDIPVKTITAWIKRKTVSNSQNIAMKGYTGGGGGWEFYVRRSTGGASGNRIGYNHEWSNSQWSTAIWYGSTDLNIADQWVHVAVVYDSRSPSNLPVMYVNGIQETVNIDVAALGTEATDSGNNLTLGGVPGETGDIELDDVRVYSRALSSVDIQQIYQLGLQVYQCSDAIDNDSDGLIDFPADPGCSSAIDDDETDPPVDVTVPSVPANLQVTASQISQVDLSWSASTDNTAVTGYNIYRSGILVGSSGTTSHSDTGLTPSTSYLYTVTAYDAAGNESPQTAAVMATTLNQTVSLVGHWKFDEGSGATATDSSGNGNDGVLVNGPAWVGGKIAGAVSLDGIDDYINAGSASSLDDIQTKTITAWIKRKDIAKTQYITMKGYTGGPGGWEFYIRRSTGGASGSRIGYNHQWSNSQWSSAIWYGSTDLNAADQWYHVAVVYDAGSAANIPKLYINGVLESVTIDVAAAGTEASDAGNNLTIGGLPGDVGDSVLDDVRIYNRGLSTAEIQQIFNQGTPVYQCSDGVDNDSDGLIDYPADPGCTSATDNDETDIAPADPFTLASSWSAFDPGANGVGVNPSGYNGGAFDGRYMYFAPSKYSPSNEVLRYDTTQTFDVASAWSSFDIQPSSGGGYAGAVFDGRYIYLVPYYTYQNIGQGEFQRYDTTQTFRVASSWTTFDPGANGVGTLGKGYWGGFFDGRYIYFSPGLDDDGEVMRYDTTLPFAAASSWNAFDPGANGVGFDPDGYKGVIGDGRYIYFVPYWNGAVSHGEILRYDSTGNFINASSWTTFNPSANGVGNIAKGFEYAVSDGRYIYFVPSYSGVGTEAYHGEVLRYDTTQLFNSLSAWAAFDPGLNGVGFDPDGYNGGFFDGKYIYFIPSYNGTAPHAEVMRYDTSQPFTNSGSWTTFDPASNGVGSNARGFAGSVSDGKYLYFIPDRNSSGAHGEFLRYNMFPQLP